MLLDRVQHPTDFELAFVLGTALHTVFHRGDVGVAARADVLEVEDDGVEILDHAHRRAVGFAVERVEDPAGARICAVFDFGARVFVAVDAMLRAE